MFFKCYSSLVRDCMLVAIPVLLLSACSRPGYNISAIGRPATISPSYQGTVIPYNIAPLNFMVCEEGTRFTVRFAVAGRDSFEVTSRGKVSIPVRKWKKLLHANRGGQLEVSIFSKTVSGWERYTPLRFTIAPEPVDPWLAYRLIEPGYEIWNQMGIYQRCLETFEEKPIMTNQLTSSRSCMNCHSFCKNDPQTMLFHIRKYHAGTIIVKEGKISKIDTKAPDMVSAGVYPRWHPNGRYVAFSVNTTRQAFHAAHPNKVEVYDLESDIMVYDTENNIIFTDSLLSSKNYFETFPEWSPDGQYLYFCSAKARPMPREYDSLRYDFVRIAFDASTQTFGKQLDTIVSSAQTRKSVALARISPDGQYIVFCMSDYGTFPIWHRDNDLYILNVKTKATADDDPVDNYHLNLETNTIRNLTEINSEQSDSYHSWSSNGRWMVFGSRRMDGTFTRPYLCYFDRDGNAHPPFVLPQKDPRHYDFSIKSYNIPEFITGKVMVSPYQFAKTAKGKAL